MSETPLLDDENQHITQSDTTDPFVDNLAMQESLRSNAAAGRRILEAAPPVSSSPQAEYTAPQPTSPDSTGDRPSRLKKALVRTGAGLALAAAAGTVGAALGTQNQQALDESKKTIAVDTITPSQAQGDLINPAVDSVEKLLKEKGLDPNTISYDDIQAELSKASEDNYQATGEGIQPGAQFEVSLNTATGGILTGGAKVTSIDIESVAAEQADKARLDTSTSPTQQIDSSNK